MLYRRKVLLYLIHVFGGTIDKLRLQKMLFLLSQKRIDPIYEFVPYHYGSYSFILVEEKNNVRLTYNIDNGLDFFGNKSCIEFQDHLCISELLRQYHTKSRNELLGELYRKYPYYAINSRILDEILDDDAIQLVKQQRNDDHSHALYTIGYESRSLENYLNALIKNNIKVLIDVRNNPVSRKPFFCKSRLAEYCNKFEIKYEHFPEVGIVSNLRKKIYSHNYEKLFEFYFRYILPKNLDTLNKILEILQVYKRIALTCYEFEICHCHRSYLAKAIAELSSTPLEVRHL
jgi:hypothetical protein